MKIRLILLAQFLLTTMPLIDATVLDDFHCRIATCGDFHHGLKHTPRHQEYVDTCYNTVYSLLSIPGKHGKCFDNITTKINPACIHALATTIQSCVRQLSDLPQKAARYYCGYTLMKHCAVNVGLERFRLNFQTSSSVDD